MSLCAPIGGSGQARPRPPLGVFAPHHILRLVTWARLARFGTSLAGAAFTPALMGERLRAGLAAIGSDAVTTVRGRGLLNAIVIRPEGEKRNAGALCYALKDAGLLAKPTHEHIIRLAPPLIITAAQIDEAVEIIAKETRRMFG